MKKCPYCAEEIQDEAILCRYCKSDLTVPPPNQAPAAGTSTAPASTTSPSAASTSPGAGAPSSGLGAGPAGAETSSFGGPSGAREAAPSSKPAGEQAGTSTGRLGPGGSSSETGSTSGGTGGEPASTLGEGGVGDVSGGTVSTPSTTRTEAGGATEGTATGAARDTAASAAAPAETVVYTHTGQRYVLGYGGSYFGIWDRQSPSAPAERFPRSDDGWRQAWTRYSVLEPNNQPVAEAQQQQQQQQQQGAPATSTGPGQSTPTASATGTGAGAAGGGEAMQYTHSGQRYLLGYGADFFGIWDRQALSQPVQRFPRSDDGWRAAWQQFSAWEPQSAEVGIGGTGN